MPGFAFPPVGPVGLASPPSPVLCSAKTALLPVSGRFARRSLPDTLPASVRSWCPHRLVIRSKLPDRARAFGRPVPHSGIMTRRQVALPSSRVTPVNACPALRPRWCPGRSPWRALDCCLPVLGNRRLSPRLGVEGYPAVHNYTYFGAPSRGLHPRSIQLRTPIAGFARGFHS
jgi:hypothetical protein